MQSVSITWRGAFNKIMNKKFKQLCITIPPISTKQSPLTSNHWTQKKPWLNWSIGCQPHLDNWISNDNTHINKQLRKNLRRFFFTQKDPTLSHKIKDNVRMDSIIAL